MKVRITSTRYATQGMTGEVIEATQIADEEVPHARYLVRVKYDGEVLEDRMGILSKIATGVYWYPEELEMVRED